MNRSMQAKNLKLKRETMKFVKDRAYRIMQDAKDPRNPRPVVVLSQHPYNSLTFNAKKKCLALGLV